MEVAVIFAGPETRVRQKGRRGAGTREKHSREERVEKVGVIPYFEAEWKNKAGGSVVSPP
jgi:hypothetical protein